MNRNNFLELVANYIASDPEAAGYLGQAAAEGLRRTLDESMQRSADMETALAITMAGGKFRGGKAIVIDKLQKWEGKTSINWSTFLAENREPKP